MGTAVHNEITVTESVEACLLCHDAPCTKACPHGVDAGGIIRSVRFENHGGASLKIPEGNPCSDCSNNVCMEECVKGRINKPVDIPAIISLSYKEERGTGKPADLSVDFCGLHCENPFFLSSSVVASNYEMVAKAFDMGWAGAVFKTVAMFTPEEVSPRFDTIKKTPASFIGFKNIEQTSEYSLNENLEYFRKLKKDYPDKILVASIMGRDEQEWTQLAEMLTETGVDMLECNFSCPHMASDGLGSDVGQDPSLVSAYTKAVKRGTDLPILAKMTPNIGNMEIPAVAAVEAGADGIAAINTIKSIMNVNLDTFSSGPDVKGMTSIGGYSGKAVKPIALRFIQSVRSHMKLADVPISGMGGIETWRDAAEFMTLGCGNIQVTTAVMLYGYRIIDDLIGGMEEYLSRSGHESIDGIIGKALPNIIDAERLDRKSICFPRFIRKNCVGCGRCHLSCFDGGHQAIDWNHGDGRPVLKPAKCVGCHLCVNVCPAGAIELGTRVSK